MVKHVFSTKKGKNTIAPDTVVAAVVADDDAAAVDDVAVVDDEAAETWSAHADVLVAATVAVAVVVDDGN